jgi:nucleoid-associated protein YgaU
MARLSFKSRYIKHPTVYSPVYKDDETDPRANPTKMDIVFVRRYTSFRPDKNFLTYRVKEGDTLPDIANRYYKNPQLWWVIADYNFANLFYPLRLDEGHILFIPPPSWVGETSI